MIFLYKYLFQGIVNCNYLTACSWFLKIKMVMGAFFFKTLLIFWSRFFLRRFRSNITYATESKHQKYTSLLHRSDNYLKDHTVIFDVEHALLRSSSVFPYFMIVAFEAGGILRAMVLILLYPVVCLCGEDVGVKIMIMVCFFGVRAERFRVGEAVLPKFLLEDVGSEIFEVVRGCGKKVGVSVLPRVMVECFLKEYLEIDVVVGKELRVFGGYYLGLTEETKIRLCGLEVVVDKGKGFCCDDEEMIGISGSRTDFDHHFFSRCKVFTLIFICYNIHTYAFLIHCIFTYFFIYLLLSYHILFFTPFLFL